MTRPVVVTAVLGTRTEIGKTWLSMQLLTSGRRRGLMVAARKPVQSYDPRLAEHTDAQILATASTEAAEEVCPAHRWYPVPMAPPMAADALNQPQPTLDQLTNELTWPHRPCDLGIIEMVGGVRSPVSADGDSRELAQAVCPDNLVIVAGADLGTINEVRLATEALAPISHIIFLNNFDPKNELHVRNHQWLVDNDGFNVETDVDRTLTWLMSSPS